MNYIWTPLFLLLAFIEYDNLDFCGSLHLTGQMWFMWFMMGMASSKIYVELIRKKLNGYS